MLITWTDKITNKKVASQINWIIENKRIKKERNVIINIVGKQASSKKWKE